MVKTILIVDDEPSVAYTVKTGLECMDDQYNVIALSGGKECLQYLKKNQKPDIILLDVMMPEMTGWETYDKIKENSSWSDIPIIFLTARTDEIARKAGNFLAEDYIEKPAKIPDIKQRIDNIFETKASK
ncbi:MAG: response regulator [Candidatus Thermoplasmatota archaeon]|nr:response regulator [Candidatus Thermoplasmatota archaeon]